MAIKVGIVGVGNCAWAFAQGLYYYTANPYAPGLMHPTIGGYTAADIEIVWAVDVDERKVGYDLSEAFRAKPNCTKEFFRIPEMGAKVLNGPPLDGVSPHMLDYPDKDRTFVLSKAPFLSKTELMESLEEAGVDVIVNYLPVGSKEATEFYAGICCDLKIHFVNPIPVFIASDKKWAKRFEEAGSVVVGDDAEAQLGATRLHRGLMGLCVDSGVKVDFTEQVNLGGNTDFLNMLNFLRLAGKLSSKLQSIVSLVHYSLGEIYVGPGGYIPTRLDYKRADIVINGRAFGGTPLTINAKIEVEDSPGSAGVVIDAVRAAVYLSELGFSGAPEGICAHLMKHPPKPMSNRRAREEFEYILQLNSTWHIVMPSRIKRFAFSGEWFSEIFTEIAEAIYDLGMAKGAHCKIFSVKEDYCDRDEYCEGLKKTTAKSSERDILFTVFCYEDREDEVIDILKNYKGQIIAINSPASEKIKKALNGEIPYFGPDDRDLGVSLAEKALEYSKPHSKFYVVSHKRHYRPFSLRNDGIESLIDSKRIEHVFVEDIDKISPAQDDVFISYGNRTSEVARKEFRNVIIATDGTEKISVDVSVDQNVASYVGTLAKIMG